MMRIYEIAPGLLQSARTHTLSDQECKDILDNYGITAIVNLWHTADPRFEGSVRWYAHNSLPDGRIYDRAAEVVENLSIRVADEIAKGGVVLVHCWGGRNRSGLVSALALTRLQGITGAEAVRAVRGVRRGALVNQHFVTYLEKRL